MQVVAPTVDLVQDLVIVATNMPSSNLTFYVVNNPPYSATNLTWSIIPAVSGGALRVIRGYPQISFKVGGWPGINAVN